MVEDKVYEIAEEVTLSYASPSVAKFSLFMKVVKELYQYRTECQLIELAVDNPLKAIEIANAIIVLAAGLWQSDLKAVMSATEKLEDVAYRMLAAVYISQRIYSPYGKDDLFTEMIYNSMGLKYTSDELEQIVEKCKYTRDEELVKCICKHLK